MPSFQDLTGKQFGERTVLRRCPGTAPIRWVVRCSCGKEDTVPGRNLREGYAGSCRECGRSRVDRVKNLTGKSFGGWRVLARAPAPVGRTSAFWEVQCSCGNRSVVSGSDLTTGHSTRCKPCGHQKYSYKVDLSSPDWCWLLGHFHGDGCTQVSPSEGGLVHFAAKPNENKQMLVEALMRVGVVSGVGVLPNGVSVYSVSLAKDLARFKVSGVGKERWMFPQDPSFWGEWVAGLLDSDGSVRPNGQVHFYQKKHGGFDRLAAVLSTHGLHFTRYRRSDRNLESVYIRKESMGLFRTWCSPRFPKKAGRLEAALDKFEKVAEIAAGAGSKFGIKGMTMTSKPTDPPKGPTV